LARHEREQTILHLTQVTQTLISLDNHKTVDFKHREQRWDQVID